MWYRDTSVDYNCVGLFPYGSRCILALYFASTYWCNRLRHSAQRNIHEPYDLTGNYSKPGNLVWKVTLCFIWLLWQLPSSWTVHLKKLIIMGLAQWSLWVCVAALGRQLSQNTMESYFFSFLSPSYWLCHLELCVLGKEVWFVPSFKALQTHIESTVTWNNFLWKKNPGVWCQSLKTTLVIWQ